MYECVIGFNFQTEEEILEAVRLAVNAGFNDWNKDQGLDIAAEVGSWTQVVVDSDGDVLLGRRSGIGTNSLSMWADLCRDLAGGRL